MNRRSFLVMVAAVAVAGCGGGQAPVSVTPAPPPPVKPFLESIASSGEMGSEVELIRQNLETLKATDSAKATELLQDLDEMQASRDPAKIKAVAKRMLEKL